MGNAEHWGFFLRLLPMPQLNANEEKAARDKLSGEISDLKKQIDDQSNKIEQVKAQRDQQKKKLDALIEKSSALSKKMKATQQERQQLFANRDELNKSSSSQFKELIKLAKELPISSWKKDAPIEKFIEPNRERIQAELDEYQAQLLQVKSMQDERRIVGRIDKLQTLKLSLNDFEEKVRADQLERDLADQYQADAQAKKEEQDRIHDEMQALQEKITPVKETLDGLWTKSKTLGNERKDLITQREKRHSELNERWTKWKAHLEQQRKKEAETRDKTPPYEASISAAKTCLTRLQAMQKAQKNKAKKEAADAAKAEADAVEATQAAEGAESTESTEKVKARKQELERLNSQVMKKRQEQKTEAEEEP